MYVGKVRGRLAQSRIQIIIGLGVLLTCAVVYVSLELFEALHWSRLAAILATLLVCFAPAVFLLARIIKAQLLFELRHQAQEIAAHERDMLRTVIDTLPDFIYMKDKDGRFLLANAFCCEAMGATLESLLGKTDFEFYPQELAKTFHDDEQAVVRSGESLLGRQEDLVTHDGRALTILTSKIPLKNDAGAIIGLIGIGRDITGRVRAERQVQAAQDEAQAEMRERERMAIDLRLAQKLESVGRLAAGLAHEINTPIQYIGDSVHFIRTAFDDLVMLFESYRAAAHKFSEDTGDNACAKSLLELEAQCDLEFLRAEMPRAIERTLEGTQRVAGIVRAMKEFAHPDTNEHKPADINHALQTTLTVAHSEYRYAAHVDTDFDALPEVFCNIGELNQVFLNLVVNSAHAIVDAGRDASTGIIKISTRSAADGIQICFEDNGCGIPQQHLDKIFDPFFTTKEVGRGTGQGLAIARSIIVDKHRGHIDVTSEVGVGTRFVITLPLEGAQRAKVA
ncbi:MAG TPA: ATP-binding protein [Steroidobacteraceae bacterium]|nr:ATP-binding protein [Steroidobacteraceae bacterium]